MNYNYFLNMILFYKTTSNLYITKIRKLRKKNRLFQYFIHPNETCPSPIRPFQIFFYIHLQLPSNTLSIGKLAFPLTVACVCNRLNYFTPQHVVVVITLTFTRSHNIVAGFFAVFFFPIFYFSIFINYYLYMLLYTF